jgi:hypothetical protein
MLLLGSAWQGVPSLALESCGASELLPDLSAELNGYPAVVALRAINGDAGRLTFSDVSFIMTRVHPGEQEIEGINDGPIDLRQARRSDDRVASHDCGDIGGH